MLQLIHGCLFVLAITGLIGCLSRFDYNIVLALGWMLLADKHPQID